MRVRIAVFGQARRRDVDQRAPPPHAHVRQVQVAERDRALRDAVEEPLERVVVRVGPYVLVVALGVRVTHEQPVLAVAEVQRERQLAEPARPLLADPFAHPRDAARILVVQLRQDPRRR